MDIIEIMNSVQKLTEEVSQVILAFTLLFAVLQCFFGYKLLKVWIGLIGFLVGFGLGFLISQTLVDGKAYIPALIGIVAGVVFALLAFRIYLIGVFIYCGAIAAGAVHALPMPEKDGWDVLGIVLCVAAFLIVGFLATKFARPFIIAVTAATGAVRVAESLQGMSDALARNHALVWMIILALAAAGMAVQFFTTRGKKRGK